MADQSTPAVRDPFDRDLGKPHETPRQVDDRPRNSDGTYAPVKPVEAPKPIEHPRYLVESALDLGYSNEELLTIPTAVLAQEVARFQRRLLQERQSQGAARAVADNEVRHLPPEPEEDDESLVDAVEKEVGMDNRISQILKKRIIDGKATKKELAELKKKLEAMETRETQRSGAQSNAMLDEAFAALPPELKVYFGDAGYFDLPESGFQQTARVAAINKSGARVDDRKCVLESQATLNAKIRRAAEEYVGKIPTAPAPKEEKSILEVVPKVKPAGKNGRPTPEEWVDAGSVLPGHRHSDELPDGDEKATRNLAKKMSVSANDRAVLDTLLH